MNSVPKLFSCSDADCWTENHFSTEFVVLTPNYTHSHTLLWGCVSRWFRKALAWHARGHRFDPGILHHQNTVDFKLNSTVFLCLSASKFIVLSVVPVLNHQSCLLFGKRGAEIIKSSMQHLAKHTSGSSVQTGSSATSSST